MGKRTQSAMADYRGGRGNIFVPAPVGVNNRDLPNILDIQSATKIQNGVITGESRLEKVKGYILEDTVSSGVNFRILGNFHDNTFVITYNTTCSVWDADTKTETTVKTDWTSSDEFTGFRYGDRFFLGNGGDGSDFIVRTLAYDAQSANFTVGKTVTGGTSGATAKILADSDGGATGTLTLTEITGTFENDETITDDNGSPGSATVNGTLGYAMQGTSNPKAKINRLWGNRIICANITSDSATGDATGKDKVLVSSADRGTGTFSWAADVDDGDALEAISFPAAGDLTDVVTIGRQVIGVSENGKFGFHVEALSSGSGAVLQAQKTDFSNASFGGRGKSVSTPFGIFYINENGLFQLLGGNEIAADEREVSEILSEQYLDQFTFTKAFLLYRPIKKQILVACAKNASDNNAILVYDLDTQGITEILGVYASSMVLHGLDVYATDSTEPNLYKLFSGTDFNDKDIHFYYESKEFDFGDKNGLKDIEEFFISLRMVEMQSATLNIDVWDANGEYKEDFISYTVEPSNVLSGLYEGYGARGYGEGAGIADTVENNLHQKIGLRNIQKLKVKISEISKYPFEVNDFAFNGVSNKGTIRKNNLTLVS